MPAHDVIEHATAEQRSRWELVGGGIGLHRPDIDEDISVENLLRPDGQILLADFGLEVGMLPWAQNMVRTWEALTNDSSTCFGAHDKEGAAGFRSAPGTQYLGPKDFALQEPTCPAAGGDGR
ncbi:MAG: DUF2442 domain-containing protein [Chloroflexi bacterium]|nr:DUF2442 domain-containing protein [Chloroflexota bacterium]MBV9599321.1 DUF2442 domain-containing protein [Chloroflexota bacterium]